MVGFMRFSERRRVSLEVHHWRSVAMRPDDRRIADVSRWVRWEASHCGFGTGKLVREPYRWMVQLFNTIGGWRFSHRSNSFGAMYLGSIGKPGRSPGNSMTMNDRRNQIVASILVTSRSLRPGIAGCLRLIPRQGRCDGSSSCESERRRRPLSAITESG